MLNPTVRENFKVQPEIAFDRCLELAQYLGDGQSKMVMREIDRPHHFRIEGNDGTFIGSFEFAFHPVSDGTRVTYTFSRQGTGLFSKMVNAVGSMSADNCKMGMTQMLLKMKEVCESNG